MTDNPKSKNQNRNDSAKGIGAGGQNHSVKRVPRQ